ncbi:uncharacterized protein LOC135384217 [Ornithodoros turicata]|uniref:uncharacterized protein LOC135384217 n=1 Tax=Ornithodoros turicata TaxID=34597 RepID=UPI003139A97B
MFAYTLLLVVVGFAAAEESPLKKIHVLQPCTTSADVVNVKEFRTSECKADPCVVPFWKRVQFEIDFVAERASDVMHVDVKGRFRYGDPLTALESFETDACNHMAVPCPLVAGKEYTAKSALQVPWWNIDEKALPLDAEAVLRGRDAGGQLFCFKVLIRLTSKEAVG